MRRAVRMAKTERNCNALRLHREQIALIGDIELESTVRSNSTPVRIRGNSARTRRCCRQSQDHSSQARQRARACHGSDAPARPERESALASDVDCLRDCGWKGSNPSAERNDFRGNVHCGPDSVSRPGHTLGGKHWQNDNPPGGRGAEGWRLITLSISIARPEK